MRLEMKRSQSRHTALEEQAGADIRQQFAEHFDQFLASSAAIEHFEKDIARLALAVNMTTARTSPSRIRLQTNDGVTWYKSLDLMDSFSACYRPTDAGTEFAVVERLPFANGHGLVARSRNAVDVLKALEHGQRKALQLWNEDLSAHVSQSLAERYPGQDMSQITTAVMRGLTQWVSHDHTQTQNRSRGIRI